MATPETSIIIRTYNEEKYLPQLLEGVGEQSYRDFEIIVVDSGSLDRTRKIAAPWANKLLRITSHDFTFGYSLNVGLQAASGKYAVIISAHMLPVDEEWLGSLIRPLGDESTASSYGRQMGWTTSKFGETQDLKRTFGTEPLVLRPPHFFGHNANSAIRMDLWRQHPFDESLPGLEDIAWAKYWMLKGYTVAYAPDAALHHIHEENWRQVRRRYYREAVAARRIGIKGRRHALLDSVKEAGYALQDLGLAIMPFTRRQSGRTVLDLSREVLMFRIHKAAGSARGVLDGATMHDPEAREAIFFDRACQAVVIHGPGRASLEEIPIPEVKPGDVLIRTAYTGVNGTDLDILDGTLGYYQSGLARYPIVPGLELSGRIVATGSNVSHLQEGEPVVVENVQSCGNCSRCEQSNWMECSERAEMGVLRLNGGYAEYVVVPHRFVHKLPSGLDLRKAALCQPLAMILRGLNRLSHCWPAEPEAKRCAVVGVGALGHLCAQVLALQGHQVTVFDRDPVRRGHFQGTGIQAEGQLNSLHEFDALVEVTGDPESLNAMLQGSAPGATILVMGLPYAQKAFTFQGPVAYDRIVVGSVGCSPNEFEEAIQVLPDLDVDQYLQCVLPLSEFREAWQNTRNRKYLKVLLSADRETV